MNIETINEELEKITEKRLTNTTLKDYYALKHNIQELTLLINSIESEYNTII